MKQLLILSLVVGSLDLIGECTNEQKKALGAYTGDVMFLAAKKESGPYINTAERLKGRAKALAAAFPGKNIVEIKKECDPSYTGNMYEVISDFVEDTLYPKGIRDSFKIALPEGGDRIEMAKGLFSSMIELGLFFVDVQMAINLSSTLLGLEGKYPVEYAQLIPILWEPLFQKNPILSDEQKHVVFNFILIPFIEKHGHSLIFSGGPYNATLGGLIGLDASLAGMKDSKGKALLHNLFEQDLSNALGENLDFFMENSGYFYLLGLPQVEGIQDQKMMRYTPLGKGTNITPFIVNLALKTKDVVDPDSNTILHTLRKNNKYEKRDADVRSFLEKKLLEDDSKLGLSQKRDSANKRYVDYPPLISKDEQAKQLDRYTSHALSLFGKSLNALV